MVKGSRGYVAIHRSSGWLGFDPECTLWVPKTHPDR